ncbi:MAG: hypothetical protein Q4G44_00205 [Alcaligenaceae bacterium]|nr:hypothetical protein [Alcaligenaceae bacterium]
MKALIFSATFLALAACSTTNSLTGKPWSPEAALTQVQEGEAAMVFYRTKSDSPVAVNIHINGEYLSSLQQDAYTQIETCAQPQRIGAFVVDTDAAYLAKNTRGAEFNPPVNSISYFKVNVADDNQVTLTLVDPQVAQQEVSNKRQSNTLSRVDKRNTCTSTAVPLDGAAQ